MLKSTTESDAFNEVDINDKDPYDFSLLQKEKELSKNRLQRRELRKERRDILSSKVDTTHKQKCINLCETVVKIFCIPCDICSIYIQNRRRNVSKMQIVKDVCVVACTQEKKQQRFNMNELIESDDDLVLQKLDVTNESIEFANAFNEINNQKIMGELAGDSENQIFSSDGDEANNNAKTYSNEVLDKTSSSDDDITTYSKASECIEFSENSDNVQQLRCVTSSSDEDYPKVNSSQSFSSEKVKRTSERASNSSGDENQELDSVRPIDFFETPSSSSSSSSSSSIHEHVVLKDYTSSDSSSSLSSLDIELSSTDDEQFVPERRRTFVLDASQFPSTKNDSEEVGDNWVHVDNNLAKQLLIKFQSFCGIVTEYQSAYSTGLIRNETQKRKHECIQNIHDTIMEYWKEMIKQLDERKKKNSNTDFNYKLCLKKDEYDDFMYFLNRILGNDGKTDLTSSILSDKSGNLSTNAKIPKFPSHIWQVGAK